MADCARSYNDGYNDGFKAGQQWAAHETYVPNILAARENEIRSHGERADDDARKLLGAAAWRADVAADRERIRNDPNPVEPIYYAADECAYHYVGSTLSRVEPDNSQPLTDTPTERSQPLIGPSLVDAYIMAEVSRLTSTNEAELFDDLYADSDAHLPSRNADRWRTVDVDIVRLDRLDSMPVTRWQEPADPHIVRSIN